MESRLLREAVRAFLDMTRPAAQVVDVASPASRRFEIFLERKGSRARLVVDLDPRHATFHLAGPRGETSPPREEMFSSLVSGFWITGAAIAGEERVLRLELNPPGEERPSRCMVIEWVGGNPALLVFETATGVVLASTQGPLGPQAQRRARGARYRDPEPSRRPSYGRADEAAVLDAFRRAGRPSAGALARSFADLPAPLAYEAFALGGEDPRAVASALRTLAGAEPTPSLYIVARPAIEDLPRAFVSPVPLSSLAEHRREEEGSLFRLLERAHDSALRAEGNDQVRERFLRIVDGEIHRLRRLRERIAGERREAEDGAIHRRKAETLIARLAAIPRGSSLVRLEAVDAEGEFLDIELDPAKSPAQNAEIHFRKARKLQRSEPLRARRLAAAEKALALLSIVREQAREESSLVAKGSGLLRGALGSFARREAIARWEEFARSVAPSATRGRGEQGSGGSSPPGAEPKKVRREREERERFRPRSYTTRDGWTVFVGRSNEENDYLTHAIARPEDLWFHVHGSPGSHVVLRREGRKDNPSAKTIEEAAAIAAYYSKARTSRKAPVIYTLKKYVRKPRGGAPGLATVTRERMIMVEPRVPAGDADASEWGA